MPHHVFDDGEAELQHVDGNGASPTASTSKVTLDPEELETPVFHRKKQKQQQNSSSSSKGKGSIDTKSVTGATPAMNGASPASASASPKHVNGNGHGQTRNGSGSQKRVKTFHDDDEEEDNDDDNDGEGTRKLARVTTLAGESKKQARQRQKAERHARAEFLLKSSRMHLPVWHAKDAILREIEQRDTVVVLGETGSGKTTQIPQFLLASGICRPDPRIAVTQPRRVAATSLARRVAEEAGCALGQLVGYTVRFDDCSSLATRLKYLTDGTLLQEILSDPLLEQYDIVTIDEAHERTLRTDMILGFLKQIQRARKELARTGEKSLRTHRQVGPLKIIVMSATLDAERFSKFYNDAKVLYIQGRSYKVEIKFLDAPVSDYIEATYKTVFQIHYQLPPGDILCFLSGQDDIEAVRTAIEGYMPSVDRAKKGDILICPLYARLTPAEQNKAFNPAPPNTRKVILATNVAETSITISGIKYVIDSGMAKEKMYHASSGLDSLMLQPVSKSNATQRAGRAGRQSNGMCFRLYTEMDYHTFRATVPPEIQRCSLTFALLHLIAAGQQDVTKFEFMDRPATDAITASLTELYGLGALSDKGTITALGRQMASLPLEPRQAKILLASFDHGCTSSIVDLLALLGSADALLAVPHSARELANAAREKFAHRTGDHLMLLNVLRAYEEAATALSPRERRQWCKDHHFSQKTLSGVLDARKQLKERVDRLGLHSAGGAADGGEQTDNEDGILRCLLEGLFTNTAMRMPDNSYRRVMGTMKVKIHPSSSLQGKQVDAVIFSELVYTSSVYARICSSIPLVWLRSIHSMAAHKPLAPAAPVNVTATSPASRES